MAIPILSVVAGILALVTAGERIGMIAGGVVLVLLTAVRVPESIRSRASGWTRRRAGSGAGAGADSMMVVAPAGQCSWRRRGGSADRVQDGQRSSRRAYRGARPPAGSRSHRPADRNQQVNERARRSAVTVGLSGDRVDAEQPRPDQGAAVRRRQQKRANHADGP